ncbi:Alanyl-tRNA editing protein AlaX-M-like protein [Hapsidospora chrysogenum ATCC 11550]|uniref:Alanyl-tRNA editing protein AlaX-M-like protein n=1 Tax=Hapsidospora chrysogenum (strain ATCC 11550 / CBS 779.69 / DSM 880 / IAM 14645 / JCM 23072 / IMI 49137) TaxID=857340 RepID=A0A086SXR2_HAPC1|nr:Alanyl-tRNA editing protein AlaX-M-like protein [Hapsidospora chrysogenum ATCC 11550]
MKDRQEDHSSSAASVKIVINPATMESIAKTELLYHKGDPPLTATVTVLVCIPFTQLVDDLKPLFKGAPEDAYIVATDKTVFYAKGGGQPADVGTMNTDSAAGAVFQVRGVMRAPSGAVLHLGTFEGAGGPFQVGHAVQQQVDAETRNLHSRIHDGGHIVSLAIRRLAPTIGEVTDLKAQHYPDSSWVEFKGLIDGKHKAEIEAAANAVVEQDLPITVCWWSKDELVERCLAVPDTLHIPQGELARAVDIEGAGAYACGGTHMRTTGEVGRITVRKISRQKGISKVSYCLA